MMSYTENPLPEIGEQHPSRLYAKITQFDIRDAQRLREEFRTKAVERDGVLYWTSSGNTVPPDVFHTAFCTPSPSHLAGHAKQVDEQISAYRERMKDYVPSAEEMFEMRAAFGEGTTAVNVVTGQRTKL